MPCNPNLTINVPEGSGTLIPGYGIQFGPKAPDFKLPTPSGFPEDLGQFVDLLNFILPSGVMSPGSYPNFMKDAFDHIMNLLDKFFPFLMLYKFFLPVLDLIICILEILCALMNPFKLRRKIRRLFRQCLPAFLSLFPVFAIVVMFISLLLLLIEIIVYIIDELIKLIDLIIENIEVLTKAVSQADEETVLGAVQKISMILCSFQNLFTILVIFKQIIDIIKEIIKLVSNIPPCDSNASSDADNCCDAEVCPGFIKNNESFERNSGTFKYLRQINSLNSNQVRRVESWQFYDSQAPKELAFINITQPYDLTTVEPTILPNGVVYNSPIFFPTDTNYNELTPPTQAAYTADLQFIYNPLQFGRIDPLGTRNVKILDCIVQYAPNKNQYNYDNGITNTQNGVLILTGGRAVEDDGVTPIKIGDYQANIHSFFHLEPVNTDDENLPNDGILININYIFRINHDILLQKALITLGCIPDVAFDRNFINTFFAGKFSVNTDALQKLTLPDIDETLNCLNSALSAFQANISQEGALAFQTQSVICLNKLKDDTIDSLNSLIDLGFDSSKSDFTLEPNIQFTTQPIIVTVKLNDFNQASIINNLPQSVSDEIILKLKAEYDFGNLSNFKYNGTNAFTAELTSDVIGSGAMKILYNNEYINIINVPTDLDEDPTNTVKTINYQFVYAPATSGGTSIVNNTGDTDNAARRNETDIADRGGN